MRTKTLSIRITEELMDKIEAEATKLGLDKSTFARMVLTKRVTINKE